jgi:hypothetical protein
MNTESSRKLWWPTSGPQLAECGAAQRPQAEARFGGARRQPHVLRIALLLFLFVNCVYLLTSSGRVRTIDEIDPVMKSESLLQRGNTAIPQAVGSGIWFGKRDLHGVPRSAWPDGQALLVLPWAVLGHWMAHWPGMPPDAADLVIGTAVCWSNATFGALAVALAFLLMTQLGLRPREALACSLLLAFSSVLFVYSAWLYTEPLSAALFVAAALALFADEVVNHAANEGAPSLPSFGRGGCSRRQISPGRAVAGGLLLAFSMHVRPSNAITVFLFIAAVLLAARGQGAKGWHALAIVVALVGVSGVIYLARNYLLFGNVRDFGVPVTGEGGKDLDSWHNPLWRGVFGFLFSPGKSALLFSLPVLLGIAGLPRLWRRNPPLAFVCGAVPLVNLCFFALRTQWEGTYCYGPRFLVPSLVLLTIPVAALFLDPPGPSGKSWLRPAFWTVAIAGFVVQAIGLATNMIEDMVANRYYDEHYDYQMWYSPITGQLRLIWKYLHVEPAGLGLGWDRWWVFLRQAGVSAGVLSAVAFVFLAGAAGFGWGVWREVREG